MNREIKTSGAPTPVGPYSQGIDAGTVYCAGQIGLDPSTGSLVDGITAQTRRVLLNIKAILEASGLGLGNVVRTTVFLADLSEYSQMNEEYAKHFSLPFPARSTVQVSSLPRGARVEIDAIAVP